ncbi:glucan biosynthesis protein [Alteromonas oceanisediminis]|uniref:glucan biosynthesis protein n=1 Tax=Alteromonas oceanisediminis TaxID=2836180 RepID=UPI001BDA486B|nr:glucan biosynthesis protein [Alteromonas oceanisediminis]MBT0585198.1 glucan biosynthesis protein G [Alteromonas oceanisediminis]
MNAKLLFIFCLSLITWGGFATLSAQEKPPAEAEPAPSPISSEQAEKPERPTHEFSRAWLEDRAQALAEQPYQVRRIDDESPLGQLSYDDYKRIQFERGATIWRREDRNFRVTPLHPGFLFKTPVNLNLVVGGVSRRILYTTDIFNYDNDLTAVKQTDVEGYSGFSVTHPINTDTKWDEFLVFQGGTYFRAVGQTNWYGLSARGLAINTAKPKGEEFPEFTDFWIERPREGAERLVVHALMQSRSATGAFTFSATPGEHTRVDVDSVIYPRTDIPHFGIAPLTSMFLLSPLDSSRFDDFRPAVHDSDGLLMVKSNGERIWRSLANPQRLQVSAFVDSNPRGFGLMQRKRSFQDFDDIEARYHLRPSAWVTPKGDWGEGHVELIEIPTREEIHDNIVAFWQPKRAMRQGQPYPFSYTLHFGSQAPLGAYPGKIVSTAAGKTLGTENQRSFVIDYAADELPSDVNVSASTSSGQITGHINKVVEETGRLRVVVNFAPGDEDLAELRVALTVNDRPWGETWLYRWTR